MESGRLPAWKLTISIASVFISLATFQIRNSSDTTVLVTPAPYRNPNRIFPSSIFTRGCGTPLRQVIVPAELDSSPPGKRH